MNWNRVIAEVERRKTKDSWKSAFGEAYGALEVCLSRTNDFAQSIWCDRCKSSHALMRDSNGGGLIAVCPCGSGGGGVLHVSDEEGFEWEFSAKKLGAKLANALGLEIGGGVGDQGFGLVDLGECHRHPERRHVWLVACPATTVDCVLELIGYAGGGCLLMPCECPNLEPKARAYGLTIISMESCFDVTAEGVKGMCDGRCKTIGSLRSNGMQLEKHDAGHTERVLIVDDSSVMAKAISLIVSLEPDLEVVGEAANGSDALERVQELKPDLVLMDVRMPVMDGIEATRRIKAQYPEMIVIGLSSCLSGGVRERMLGVGAICCIEKDGVADRLVTMIRRAIHARGPRRPVESGRRSGV